MKNIFFILFAILLLSSCTYEDSGFRRISKEEAMKSWAWKIFVFTDEGETKPIVPYQNDFDESIKGKPIFVDDFWEINLRDDLFLKNHDVAFEEGAHNYNFVEIKRKK